MNTKIIFAITFSFLITGFTSVKCQPFHALHIGDTLPDVELKMLGYKTNQVHLSDFKGKLLILDFWSDWCSTCIAQFPRFDSLQKQFGDKMYILPVGFDEQPGSIERFRNSRKGTKREMKMPTAVEAVTDSAMMQLFPHQGVPNEVWINKDGVLISVTDQYAVNQQTISEQLSGLQVNLPQKMYNSNFDFEKPLLTNNNGANDTAFSFRSLIIPYLNTIPSFVITTANKKFTHLAYLNTPVLNMLKSAVQLLYPEAGFEMDPLNKRVLINIPDSGKGKIFNDVSTDDYLALEAFKHSSWYTYEALLPAGYTLNDANTLMLRELETYFKVKVQIEEREINCLALVRTSNTDKLGTAKRKKDVDISEDNLEFNSESGPIKELVDYFNTYFKIPFTIDKTGYTGNVNLHIMVSGFSNLSALRQALNPYDLDLIPIKTKLDMIIIQDSGIK